MKEDKGKSMLFDAVFVSWMNFCRRAAVLSDVMGVRCLFVKNLINSRGLVWRLFFLVDYLYKAMRTSMFLMRYRPDTVFAQSPPSLCPMLCFAYCKFFGKDLVVDAHNKAFERPWIYVPGYKHILRAAKTVIVHNREYADYLRQKYPGISFFVLPDKLPVFAGVENRSYEGQEKYFLVILSYDRDEPVKEILDAAIEFMASDSTGITFKITGNYKKTMDVYQQYKDADGIDFLGFVSDKEYIRYLLNAYGVIALSTRKMIQQSATVEALGASVPLIVSETPTSQRLFFKGAVITRTDKNSILWAIRDFCDRRDLLAKEIVEVRSLWESDWKKSYNRFLQLADLAAL